jgi:putative membrane protein insertion efficiency factor
MKLNNERLSILAKIALKAIRFYQKRISVYTPPVCRFIPTCSEYSAQAVTKYGFFKGTRMGFLRICRCNPWNPGGYDPVPGTEKTQENDSEK